jgi:Ran GTPase-activating protein (RanGAP) involved in mRNA processing and transport
MAYYFHSDNVLIVPGGTDNPYFGVRVWRNVSEEFLKTPAVFRHVYSFLTLEEKLPHCSVNKKFRSLIGAADVVVRSTTPIELHTGMCDPRRFLTSLADTESQQYINLRSLTLGTPESSELCEIDINLLSECLQEQLLPALMSITIIRLTPPDDPSISGLHSLMNALNEGVCPDLEELAALSCGLGPVGIKEIADVIRNKKCVRLRSCQLYNNCGGGQAMIDLAKTFRLCPNMRALDLGLNELQEMGTKAVCDVLRFIPEVRVLKLGGNKLMNEGGQMLEPMIDGEYLCECVELHLQSNADDPEYTIAIARGLGSGHCPSLALLDLSGNGMGWEGAQELERVLALECCPSLKVLRIGDNGLGPAGLKFVNKFLPKVHKLEELDISGNNAGPAAIQEFLQVLIKGVCPTLEALNINSNEIGDIGFKWLGRLLMSGGCTCIKRLHAAHNHGGDDGMVEFAPALYTTAGTHLEVLDIGYNNIRSNGLLRLADGLGDEITRTPNCPNLSWLNLAGLGDQEYVWAVQEKVREYVCPSLTALNITLNDTKEAGRQYLKAFLSKPHKDIRRKQMVEARQRRMEREKLEFMERMAEKQNANKDRQEAAEKEEALQVEARQKALEKLHKKPKDRTIEHPHQLLARSRRWGREEQKRVHGVEQEKLKALHTAEWRAPLQQGMSRLQLKHTQNTEATKFVNTQKQQQYDLHHNQMQQVKSTTEKEMNVALDLQREEQRKGVKDAMREAGFIQ